MIADIPEVFLHASCDGTRVTGESDSEYLHERAVIKRKRPPGSKHWFHTSNSSASPIDAQGSAASKTPVDQLNLYRTGRDCGFMIVLIWIVDYRFRKHVSKRSPTSRCAEIRRAHHIHCRHTGDSHSRSTLTEQCKEIVIYISINEKL